MPFELDNRVFNTLRALEESGVVLVEWDTPLLSRAGYPLAPRYDLHFLVPDDQIHKAHEIATANGLRVVEHSQKEPYDLSEYAKQGFHYSVGDKGHRLMLLPLSRTGLELDELEILPSPKHIDSLLPCTVWTMPLSAICAACLRVIIQEKRSGIARQRAISDLASVLCYSMFDTSYEGSAMILPEEDYTDEELKGWGFVREKLDPEKDASEMEQALEKMRSWRFRKDDEWTRETLIQLVTGQLSYDHLPYEQ